MKTPETRVAFRVDIDTSEQAHKTNKLGIADFVNTAVDNCRKLSDECGLTFDGGKVTGKLVGQAACNEQTMERCWLATQSEASVSSQLAHCIQEATYTVNR